MLFLYVARGNAGRRWRWCLWMTLQRMHRSHLWHSGMLIDGISVYIMIAIVTRVGRVVSVQR